MTNTVWPVSENKIQDVCLLVLCSDRRNQKIVALKKAVGKLHNKDILINVNKGNAGQLKQTKS